MNGPPLASSKRRQRMCVSPPRSDPLPGGVRMIGVIIIINISTTTTVMITNEYFASPGGCCCCCASCDCTSRYACCVLSSRNECVRRSPLYSSQRASTPGDDVRRCYVGHAMICFDKSQRTANVMRRGVGGRTLIVLYSGAPTWL